MFTLIAENERGERLSLTDNPRWDVADVTGTNPAPAAIGMKKYAGADGSAFSSASVQNRNIVITLSLKVPIEENRLILYRFFRTKQRIRLLYTNKHRDVYIPGYIESVENNPFTQQQLPQISVICPDPFWRSAVQEIADFSAVRALFEFPFSIPDTGMEFSVLEHLTATDINAGEIETGAVIRMSASGAVENPRIYNRTTQEYFGLTYTMAEGDLITVDTRFGEKSVTVLHGSTVAENILHAKSDGSAWLTFYPGRNQLDFDADSGAENLSVSVTLTPLFEGV